MAQNDKRGGSRDGAKEERGFAAMDPEKQREIASKGGDQTILLKENSDTVINNQICLTNSFLFYYFCNPFLKYNTKMAYSNNDLMRFLDAQNKLYLTALAEIKKGKKETHWMWFIFPQFTGLGDSEMSRRFAMDMDFRFLLHPEKKLLSIGFNVTTNALDQNCYDLLASEARLASLFAIAKGEVVMVGERFGIRFGQIIDPEKRAESV